MTSAAASRDNRMDNTEKYRNAAGREPNQDFQYNETNMPERKKRSRWEGTNKVKQEGDWWFACTAIPLLAATLGPLANVLSIAALVTSWRETVFVDGEFVPEFDGVKFADPRWCYWLNVASLIFGFLGNLFLLFNFTQRIRYRVALPVTIISWFLSTAFLMGITICMHLYAPPNRPYETYTQGYWYAVIATVIYCVCSMILMINMLGYFLGHYPDTFDLTDAQRTLILQTMMFFIWLAGGAAIFSRMEGDQGEPGWGFSDALYFCDVTILTVGFGDLYPSDNVARGFVFPYSVGGIITLGLVISSIYKFMGELGEDKIIRKHVDRVRERTISRTVTNSFDLRERVQQGHHYHQHRLRKRQRHIDRKSISAPIEARPANRTVISKIAEKAPRIPILNPKRRVLLLREERDRFNEMRRIQHSTKNFKRWYALTFSTLAFGILWSVGAIVFWQAEKNTQRMTYFQALYFCYISLLTIGYGDLAPKSNAGRCFFVVWSLVAVPTMTILVSDMGDTVVDKFKKSASSLADFTVLPKQGIWKSLLERYPRLLGWIQRRIVERAVKKRLRTGFATMDPEEGAAVEGDEDENNGENENENGGKDEGNEAAEAGKPSRPADIITPSSLCGRLALSIRRVAANLKTDLRTEKPKKYSYEEWVEFSRLIRASRKIGMNPPDLGTTGKAKEKNTDDNKDRGQDEDDNDEKEGLGDWDWIGDDSPLLADVSESEWLLSRLCDALVRVDRSSQRKAEVRRWEKNRVVHEKIGEGSKTARGDG
ncbi:voltage-gated potassium channel [Delitschia confertaspora ATCC 74209]|uniref:Voltage-gated potassium channel n=1 Tax=Delitschia confertaspora ATCC 74209 TaxID=1513339 RepID=A0A9P4JWI3_9PLEO|nr:voltage-gated potassium channel [Delitschia confertaspora ATCC 74209]